MDITDAEFGETRGEGDVGVGDVLDLVQADELGEAFVEDYLQDVDEFVVDVHYALAEGALGFVVVEAAHAVGEAVHGFEELGVGEVGDFVGGHEKRVMGL
jgi:hypothetical protein